jgi:hypothetical protein
MNTIPMQSVQALPGPAFEVIETEFFFQLLVRETE